MAEPHGAPADGHTGVPRYGALETLSGLIAALGYLLLIFGILSLVVGIYYLVSGHGEAAGRTTILLLGFQGGLAGALIIAFAQILKAVRDMAVNTWVLRRIAEKRWEPGK